MTSYKYDKDWYLSGAANCAYEGDWEGEKWWSGQAQRLATATAAAEEAGMTIGDYLFREGWSAEDINHLIGEVVFTAVWSGYSPLMTYASRKNYKAAVEAANEENGRCYEEPHDYYHAGNVIPLELARELAAKGQLILVD